MAPPPWKGAGGWRACTPTALSSIRKTKDWNLAEGRGWKSKRLFPPFKAILEAAPGSRASGTEGSLPGVVLRLDMVSPTLRMVPRADMSMIPLPRGRNRGSERWRVLPAQDNLTGRGEGG